MTGYSERLWGKFPSDKAPVHLSVYTPDEPEGAGENGIVIKFAGVDFLGITFSFGGWAGITLFGYLIQLSWWGARKKIKAWWKKRKRR